MQHLLNSRDLSKEEILTLFQRASEFLPTLQAKKSLDLAKGKILATLFFEASTRTRFSFETAMLRLGGAVISNADMGVTSSAKKGESLYDTGKTVSQMADIIAMRHPEKGSVEALAKGSDVPVMNGGDGPGDHPTQGLLDVFTIQNELGRLSDFTIAMVGDLKYSRVVHAQCELLRHFKGIRFILVSPKALSLPDEYKSVLAEAGFEIQETEDLEEAISKCDVLSDTRIQEERFVSRVDYEKFNGVYVLTPALMMKAKKEMIVIDPLPRINHIDPKVDEDPRAKYFVQVQNGVALRMALIANLLGL
jgi:aspartate carbamoyltransferase